MPMVHIDGFLLGDVDTSVRIYDASFFGTSTACELWAGSPGATGSVRFELPQSMIGKAIQLTVAGGLAKYYGVTLPINRLGVFHSVNLEFDRARHSGQSPFTPALRAAAEARVLASHRQAKYRNYALSVIFGLATVASVFIGLLISGIAGLAAGAALTITSLLLGNFASGWSRGV